MTSRQARGGGFGDCNLRVTVLYCFGIFKSYKCVMTVQVTVFGNQKVPSVRLGETLVRNLGNCRLSRAKLGQAWCSKAEKRNCLIPIGVPYLETFPIPD